MKLVARPPARPVVGHVVRSELVRLRRRSTVVGWAGLTALFAALVCAVVFQVVEQAGAAGVSAVPDGPGVSFPDAAQLLSPAGLVAPLASGASFTGVVTLAFWALATATDSSTGLVRQLVAAEPRRGRLLVGKWLALALVTAATTAVAVVVTVAVAPVAAAAGGWEPTAWGEDVAGTVLRAGLDLYLSQLVWGSAGLALAVLTRSAGVAIGVGVGWVLLVEAVLGALSRELGDWLPGAVLGALAAGGTDRVGAGTALGLGALYVAVALSASLVVFSRRDVTD